jgi:hypothetical protein
LPNDAGAGPATGVTPIPKALIHGRGKRISLLSGPDKN